MNDALQYSLFDALPVRTGRAALMPTVAQPVAVSAPVAKEKPRAAAPAPAAVPGLGGKVLVGDWIVLDTRTDRIARDFDRTAGHVEAVVMAPFPVPGLLLAYAHREAAPERWTHVLGGFRTPHPFDAVSEIWRRTTSGEWSKVS